MSQQLKSKKLDFPERVNLLRKRMGLNQVQFAQELGVSDEYVSQIEKGKRDPGETVKILVGHLEEKFQLGEAVDSNSVEPGVALEAPPRETRTIEQCRERIKELEAEVARLWRMIEASRPHGISYGLRRTEAQAIGAQAGAADDLENPPSK